MRYLLLLHGPDARAGEAGLEDELAFLARFEDELAMSAELEWGEVLAAPERAVVVTPDGADGATPTVPPIARILAMRVSGEDRARELAACLASGTGATIELRECLPGAQRP